MAQAQIFYFDSLKKSAHKRIARHIVVIIFKQIGIQTLTTATIYPSVDDDQSNVLIMFYFILNFLFFVVFIIYLVSGCIQTCIHLLILSFERVTIVTSNQNKLKTNRLKEMIYKQTCFLSFYCNLFLRE